MSKARVIESPADAIELGKGTVPATTRVAGSNTVAANATANAAKLAAHRFGLMDSTLHHSPV
jgi:hypothetical protein